MIQGNRFRPRRADDAAWSCRLLTVLVLAATIGGRAPAEPPPERFPGPTPRPSGSADAVVLQSAALTEGSGLAASNRRPGRLWIHNDSGAAAELYAVDSSGNRTGHWRVQGAAAVDWEDMASFVQRGRPRLLVADVGDNQASRRSVWLYLIDEPDPDGTGVVPLARRIEVVYPDGPCDCEAVAVDVAAGQILLVTKTIWPAAVVYAVPLDDPQDRLVARRLASVPMPLVTAMDIDRADGTLLLAGYFDGFLYRRRAGDESAADALGGRPQHVALPRLRQIEGACFDADGQVWVCSEGTPGRLAQVVVAATRSGDGDTDAAGDPPRN